MVLLFSTLKWLGLASGIGAVAAGSTFLFLSVLTHSIAIAESWHYHVVLLPLGLAVSAWVTTTLVPETAGHGTEHVVQAFHLRQGAIRAVVIPAKLFATVVTITSGGSAGNIGPCAQIGAALASQLGERLKLNHADRKKLVICGLTGGFAAIFGTPVAAALFGAEVLFVGRFLYSVFFPSIVSAVVSVYISQIIGVPHLTFPPFDPAPFTTSTLIFTVLGGIVFGLVALLFIEILQKTHVLVQRQKLTGPLQGAVGGVLLLLIAHLFTPEVLGLGTDLLFRALSGKATLGTLFLVKILATSFTLNLGGSGGILLPLAIVGATAGAVFAEIIGDAHTYWAALGLVAVLAGAANIPLTAMVLSMELFGASIAPGAAIVCMMSYLLTGHRSVIPTQLLETPKSSSLLVELGKEIQEARPIMSTRERTLSRAAADIMRRSRVDKRKKDER